MRRLTRVPALVSRGQTLYHIGRGPYSDCHYIFFNDCILCIVLNVTIVKVLIILLSSEGGMTVGVRTRIAGSLLISSVQGWIQNFLIGGGGGGGVMPREKNGCVYVHFHWND